MARAARRPALAGRLLLGAAAALVFLAHAVLVPLHLVAHHVGETTEAHLAAHALAQAAAGHGHAHGHGHDDGGPDEEHDFGDHGGDGHLLEVQPRTAAKAPLPSAPSALQQPGDLALAPLAEKQPRTAPAAPPPKAPPPCGPAPSRGPPIG